MTMRKFLILALALSLGMPASMVGTVAYACQMTGEVSPVCCCASEDGENETVVMASQPPCCEVRSSENPKSSNPAPSNSGDLRLRVASPAALVSYLPLCSGTTLPTLATAKKIAPAPPFLVNQSFRC